MNTKFATKKFLVQVFQEYEVVFLHVKRGIFLLFDRLLYYYVQRRDSGPQIAVQTSTKWYLSCIHQFIKANFLLDFVEYYKCFDIFLQSTETGENGVNGVLVPRLANRENDRGNENVTRQLHCMVARNAMESQAKTKLAMKMSIAQVIKERTMLIGLTANSIWTVFVLNYWGLLTIKETLGLGKPETLFSVCWKLMTA